MMEEASDRGAAPLRLEALGILDDLGQAPPFEERSTRSRLERRT